MLAAIDSAWPRPGASRIGLTPLGRACRIRAGPCAVAIDRRR